MINRLIDLNKKIERLEVAEKAYKEADEKLRGERSRRLTKVDEFDCENKEKYIRGKVGCSPEKPKGVIKLIVPMYLTQKKEYEKTLEDYKKKYKCAEEEYYKEFADTRDKIEMEDRTEIASSIRTAEENRDRANVEFKNAEMALKEDDLVSDRLKNKEIVGCLIDFFHDGRVETLKEAINLYYEELHRKVLETFAEEQLKLTEEARDYARQAAESASEAAESAMDAANSAKEAICRADEAYERADEAYSEAQDAYYVAKPN